ncbi:hypothetical protein KAT60_00415 [Candidatus Woesebacteria bacterium]|nr:hypothetical protein [Candidatus Woesebacteria bacterium]
MHHDITKHQKKQLDVIKKVETQVQNKSIGFSMVSEVEDYKNDPRICLTSLHFPTPTLAEKLKKDIQDPLRTISPNHYYYPESSLHTTIKNIRVINYSPHFNKDDVEKAKKVLAKVVPKHHRFKIYYYKLLMFPTSLSLMGTTDPEYDQLIVDLDKELRRVGVPDDKNYVNKKYFFSNITLARLQLKPSEKFKQKVLEISENLNLAPYTIDSVSLIVGNAVLHNHRKIKTYKLK